MYSMGYALLIYPVIPRTYSEGHTAVPLLTSYILSLLFCCSEEDGERATPRWDFGLHPSDAAVVCREEMTGGGRLVNTGHSWHPGRLLHYGRAELKQSDHRWARKRTGQWFLINAYPIICALEPRMCNYALCMTTYQH